MSAREPRFEVVRVDGGYFVRFVAANGRIVWVTPGLYSKRVAAFRAIEVISGFPVQEYRGGYEVSANFGVSPDFGLLEVRNIDGRGA